MLNDPYNGGTHLPDVTILQYTKAMNMEFRSGRSTVDAQLHWLGEDSSNARGHET